MNAPLKPGNYLRQARLKRDLSQSAVASSLKVRYQSIGNWERNIAPVPKNKILGLKKILGISATYLINLMAEDYRQKLLGLTRKNMRKEMPGKRL